MVLGRLVTERHYRIVVADLPHPADRRELLELVLAAASLDLDVQVWLLGRAWHLLGGDGEPGWRQLLAEGLAEVWVDGSIARLAELPPGVRAVDPASPPAIPPAAMVIRT